MSEVQAVNDPESGTRSGEPGGDPRQDEDWPEPTGPLAGMPMHSTVEGAAWPVFPDRAGEAMLAMMWQFERTERMAPNRLRAFQLAQVGSVVRHAGRHVGFYRDLWRSRGLDLWAGPLTQKRFEALPVITRAMLQQAGEAAFSAVVPAGHGAIRAAETAGSTKGPFGIRTTDLTQFMWRAFTLRDHLWHRRDLTGKLAAIRRLPMAQVQESNWGLATAALCATGPAVGLDIDHPVDAQAQWLIDENPDSLITSPVNLHALADWFVAHGPGLPRLKDIRTVSGGVSAEQRAACRRAFGLPLVDSYSTRALGYLALQCPAHEHYHVQSEGALVELLDDDGQPVASGASGRVVVTSLHNFAMPFIRYDTGDFATAGAPCDCGRSLPVLARIDGRARSGMRTPFG